MKDTIIIKSIIYYCIMAVVLIYSAICFFRGINAFNNKQIITNSVVMKILATKIIPILLLVGAFRLGGLPILDYAIKDYKTTQGILVNINVPYRYITTEEFYIEGDVDPYYLPKGLISTEKKGTEYEFIYAKRSRIILEIKEIK